MAEQTKVTLKGYFNTGDAPTEANFEDLIDSFPQNSERVNIGAGTPFLWRYAAGATPPADAAVLQAAEGVDTAVAVGHVCVTNTGDIFKCNNAANQEALVWGKLSSNRRFAALITQVGTDAPQIVNTYINDFGSEPTFGRALAGLYTITFADETFTRATTMASMDASGSFDGASIKRLATNIGVSPSNSITLLSFLYSTTGEDGWVGLLQIEKI